jgi:hypothetical protein
MQVHIPKCAGTAVADWLKGAMLAGLEPAFASLYPDYDLPPDVLWNVALHDPRITLGSAHNVHLFPAEIGGRRMHYFTLLREPMMRSVSAMRYMLQERNAPGMPASVLGLRDLVDWVLTARSVGGAIHQNAQTNHLALHAWCLPTNGRCTPETYGAWSALDTAAYRRERTRIAKDALDEFLVVGTVERIGTALGLLRERVAAFGISLLPAEALQRVNETIVPPGDVLTWLERDPIAERFRERIAVDRELYDYANALLDRAGREASGRV